MMVSCGQAVHVPIAPRPPLYAIAVTAKTRNEDVRLSGALSKRGRRRTLASA